MNAVSTVILAGGLGTRIGGGKGLQYLHGRALLDWVLMVVRPQSAEVMISVHAHDVAYERDDCRLIVDQTQNDWIGPLAGLQSALCNARHDWIASVPCDTPFLPDDLIVRLSIAINPFSEAVVAMVEGQRQPTVALYRKDVLPKLDDYLASGARKVGDWLNTLRVNEVVFEDAAGFANINSLSELLIANQASNNIQRSGSKMT